MYDTRALQWLLCEIGRRQCNQMRKRGKFETYWVRESGHVLGSFLSGFCCSLCKVLGRYLECAISVRRVGLECFLGTPSLLSFSLECDQVITLGSVGCRGCHCGRWSSLGFGRRHEETTRCENAGERKWSSLYKQTLAYSEGDRGVLNRLRAPYTLEPSEELREPASPASTSVLFLESKGV